jgi:nicotinamide phosphoribosyltransferase
MTSKVLPLPRFTAEAPRMCTTDAYTACAGSFDSPEARDYACYYLTFRKFMADFSSDPVNGCPPFIKGDVRFVFFGLRPIIERLLLRPVTHAEIDEAKAFYADRKVMGNGTFKNFEFEEHLWRRVVDEFDGFIPIAIDALPEGSTFYPNEPMIRVRNTVKGFGPLAAWFEASIMKVWNASQRGTMNRHWLDRVQERIRLTEADISDQMLDVWSRAFCHDFSARATASDEENAHCAMYDLMVFHGTDTFHGAFYAWRDGAPNQVGNSVWAGAHHSVQGYRHEGDFYDTIYNNAPDNAIISMIGDCYDWYAAVENHLFRLALRSRDENNGKIVVARPDSSEDFAEKVEQMLKFCRRAVELGLYTEKRGSDGRMYKFATFARMIQGDSMTHAQMNAIDEAMIAEGFAPHGWYVYGLGGYRIRAINRDTASAKYALYAVGEDNRPVIKLSMVEGKRTRPYCKVIRTPEALRTGVTVVGWDEPGEDIMVPYYYGDSHTPFKEGFQEKYDTISRRVNEQFARMPAQAGQMSDKLRSLSDYIARSHLKG